MNKIILVLLVGLSLLTGCSRLDIAFRWADTYIASKVDDYFDISSQQSKELKKDLQKDLQGIKTQVLPKWIDRLNEINKEVAQSGTVSDERVSFYIASFMKDIETINSHFSNTAVDFIATTNDQQLEHFTKYFHKKNQEDLAKAENIAKFRSEYKDKYTDWFEMFVGRLTKEQKAMVIAHLEATPFPLVEKVKNKEFVFAKFAQEKSSPEQLKTFVRKYYENPEQYDSQEYRQAFANYQKDLQKLVSQVLASLSADQVKALKINLTEKTQQLERIADRQQEVAANQQTTSL